MSVDATAALVGAVLCGAAGLGVPDLIRRMRDERYASVAALPRLRLWASLTSAAAGALLGAAVGLAWPLLFLLPLVPIGTALAVIDLHTHLLPTKVVWPALAGTVLLAGVAAVADGDPAAFVRAAIGGAAVFGLFHLLWWVYPAGMGYGDVRLSAIVGFVLGYLGWAELLIGVYGAFLVFAVLGVLRAVVRGERSALRTALPFGPFLLAGVLLGAVLGSSTWSYLV